MAKFRKKPVEIEARQFDGTIEGANAIIGWGGAHGATIQAQKALESEGPWSLVIETLEGAHTASAGDWIIKGVKGEFYPCKPDIFAATYEPTGA